MPKYDYACAGCHVEFERTVSIDQREFVDCPECLHPAERKFTFSGTVWSPTSNGGMS